MYREAVARDLSLASLEGFELKVSHQAVQLIDLSFHSEPKQGCPANVSAVRDSVLRLTYVKILQLIVIELAMEPSEL